MIHKDNPKPIGRANDSAFSGIEVYEIVYGNPDKVKFKRFRPLKGKTVHSKMITAEIKHTIRGGAFNSEGKTYYFDEIEKVN